MNNTFRTSAKFPVLLCTALLCATALFSCKPRTVAVTGTGTVYRQADLATINLAVVTENASVEEASRQNAETVNRVRTNLIEAGYSADSIVTDSYTIFQDIHYRDGVRTRGDYRVSNSMHIVVRDMSKIGNTIDVAVRAGANEFNSILFSLSDMDTALEEAKVAAIKNARTSAELMVAAADASLGKVLSIEEQQHGGYSPVANNFSMYDAAAAGETPVSPGKQKISVSVVCTYAIRGK